MGISDESYQEFIAQVHLLLVSDDWTVITDVPEPFTHLFTRIQQKTIVSTRQALVFLHDTGFSQQEIGAFIEKIYASETCEGNTPLFPAITIIIFVQDRPHNITWIQQHGKKRNVLQSRFTISWVVNLQDKILYRHHGLPLVKQGAQKIEEALHSF